EHAIKCQLMRWSVSDREQNSAAPLSTEADALPEAADGQQQGRGESDEAVGGKDSYGERGQAHCREGEDKGLLSSDAVAEVAEEGTADRTREKCNAEGCQRCEHRGGRVSRGKEKLRDYQHGGRGVDVEVEKLHGGADHAGEEHLAWGVDALLGSFALRRDRPKIHSGIFPCFLGGFLSRLVCSISSAWISFLRVSRG